METFFLTLCVIVITLVLYHRLMFKKLRNNGVSVERDGVHISLGSSVITDEDGNVGIGSSGVFIPNDRIGIATPAPSPLMYANRVNANGRVYTEEALRNSVQPLQTSMSTKSTKVEKEVQKPTITKYQFIQKEK